MVRLFSLLVVVVGLLFIGEKCFSQNQIVEATGLENSGVCGVSSITVSTRPYSCAQNLVNCDDDYCYEEVCSPMITPYFKLRLPKDVRYSGGFDSYPSDPADRDQGPYVISRGFEADGREYLIVDFSSASYLSGLSTPTFINIPVRLPISCNLNLVFNPATTPILDIFPLSNPNLPISTLPTTGFVIQIGNVTFRNNSFINPLPDEPEDNLVVTDGVKGGIYNRKYKINVPDLGTYNGYINFNSKHDPGVVCTSLTATYFTQRFPNGPLLSQSIDLTNQGKQNSDGSIDYFGLFQQVAPNSRIVFSEQVQVLTCFTTATFNSYITFKNYCGGTTTSDFCTVVGSSFSPKISSGNRSATVSLIKKSTINNQTGKYVFNYDASNSNLLSLSPTITNIGACFKDNTSYTTTAIFENNSPGTLAARYVNIVVQNVSKVYVPLESMSISIVGVNGLLKARYSGSQLTFIGTNINGYEGDSPIFSSKLVNCTTGTSILKVNFNAIQLATSTSFIDLQKGEKLILAMTEFICCDVLMEQGGSYELSSLRLEKVDECTNRPGYDVWEDGLVLGYYSGKAIPENTIQKLMSGQKPSTEYNGAFQTITTKLDFIDKALTRIGLFDPNTAVFNIDFVSQHGITMDLETPYKNAFLWDNFSQHQAKLTIQINSFASGFGANPTGYVPVILTLTSYLQDPSASEDVAPFPSTITSTLDPLNAKTHRTAHLFRYQVPYATLFGYASTISGFEPQNPLPYIVALLNGSKVSYDIKAYCTPLTNSFFNLNLSFDPQPYCSSGSCSNILARYADYIAVNCPGCTTPGTAINYVSINRTMAYLGLTDDNNDRIPDNGAICTTCRKDNARLGDELQTNIQINFTDGDPSLGGFNHQNLVQTKGSAFALSHALVEIKGLEGNTITKIEITTGDGITMPWVTVSGANLFSINSNTLFPIGSSLPYIVGGDVSLWLPSTLLGINKANYSFLSTNGKDEVLQVRLTHKITEPISREITNKNVNIHAFATNSITSGSVYNSIGDASNYSLLSLVSIPSGLSYWCQQNLCQYRFLPFTGDYYGPTAGSGFTGSNYGNAQGDFCTPRRYNSNAIYPSDISYSYWKEGFQNEYRTIDMVKEYQTFVPNSVQLNYIKARNAIRIRTTTGDNIYYQNVIYHPTSPFITATPTTGGVNYKIRFITSSLTSSFANALVANGGQTTTATSQPIFYQSDDVSELRVDAFYSFPSCRTGVTSTALDLGTTIMRYDNPTFLNYPSGNLDFLSVLNNPIGEMNVINIDQDIIKINKKNFTFKIRVTTPQPLKPDGSKYYTWDSPYNEIQSMPVENAFITFTNIPSTLTITGISPFRMDGSYISTITVSPGGLFRLGTIPANSTIDYEVQAAYVCDDVCKPNEVQGCLNNYPIYLRYGWNCQGYPINGTSTALSGFCSQRSIPFLLTSDPVQTKVLTSLSVGGLNINNGATIDYCQTNYVLNYQLQEQANGYHTGYGFRTLLPPGFIYNTLSTVTFNGVAISPSYTLKPNTVGSGNWLEFSILTVPGAGIDGTNQVTNSTFSFTFPLSSTCDKQPGLNSFQFQTEAADYCGKSTTITSSSINVHVSTPSNFYNGYSISMPTTVPTVLNCPSSTGLYVTVQVTKLSHAASTGMDILRVNFPSELRPINTVAGYIYTNNYIGIPIQNGDIALGNTRSYTIGLSRNALATCATRTIVSDMLGVRTLTCAGNVFCTTTAVIPGVQANAPLYIPMCLPNPIIAGPSGACGNTSALYSISNSTVFPSNTLWAWTTTNSLTGNGTFGNLTVTTISGGRQATIAFGSLAGMDFIHVSALLPNANTTTSIVCMAVQNQRLVETYSLPLNQGNYTGAITLANGISPSVVCSGQSVTFTQATTSSTLALRAGISTTNFTYNWYTPGGMVLNQTYTLGGFITSTYSAPGIYTVSLVGNSGRLCSQQARQTITVQPTLSIPSISGINAICGNSTATFAVANLASFPANTRFSWSVSSYLNNSNLTLSATTGSSISVAFGDKPGLDNLVLTASAAGWCGTYTVQQAITTYPLPLYQTNYGGNIIVSNSQGFNGSYCINQSIPLQRVGGSGPLNNRIGVPPVLRLDYYWDLATYTLSGTNYSINAVYSVSGIYSIAYKGLTDFGCYQEWRNTITVQPSLPIPSISGINAICGNSTATFAVANLASFPANTRFSWSVSSYLNNSNLTLSATTGSSISVAFGDKPGLDNLVLTASAAGWCGTYTVQQAITTYPLPLYGTRDGFGFGGSLQLISPANGLGFNGSYCINQPLSFSYSGQGAGLYNPRIGVPTSTYSFAWDLAITSLSGNTNPATITFTAPGAYSVAYTGLTNFGCYQERRNTINVFPTACGVCLASNQTSRTLGIPATLSMDVLDASTFPNNQVILDGTFLVNNNITFMNGTFVLKPGSTILMAGTIPGNSFNGVNIAAGINVINANLVLDASTITGCETMWNGIAFSQNTSIVTNGTAQMYSKIKDYIEIYLPFGVSTTNINYTVFENNFRSLILGGSKTEIRNSIFTANPLSFKYPMRRGIDQAPWLSSPNGVPLSGGYSYAQIELLSYVNVNPMILENTLIEKSYVGLKTDNRIPYFPFDGNFSPYYNIPDVAVAHEINRNTFKNNFYNIVNYNNKYNFTANTVVGMNNSMEYNTYFPNNLFNPNPEDFYNAGKLNAVGNSFQMEDPKDGLPGINRTGINNLAHAGVLSLSNNSFQGYGNAVNVKLLQAPQLGLYSYTALYDQVTNNTFKKNKTGVLYTINQVYSLPLTANNSCNTYDVTGIASANGLNLNTYGNPLTFGSDQSPSGNRFVGYTSGSTNYSIYNNGADADYWFGQNENAIDISVGGLRGARLNPSGFIANCSGQGFSNGIGRLAAQMQDQWSLGEVKDSLKLKLGTKTKQKEYQAFIAKTYTENQDFEGLKLYAATLKNCNREAYYTFCFYLMTHYTQLGDSANLQTCKLALLSPNPNDIEVLNRLKYMDVVKRPLSVSTVSGIERFFRPLGKLSISDSTTLAEIAHSGTSVADPAKEILKRYSPWFDCDTRITYDPSLYDTVQCDSNYIFVRKGVNEKSVQNALGEAFPNPTINKVSIPYVIQTEFELAFIEIVDIVNGRKLVMYPIDKDNPSGAVEIDASLFGQGVLGYNLTIDGKPSTMKKLVVIK